MAKDIRRVHPRISYEQKIRLLGNDGKPVIVGRTLNLSPSGIYVRAPYGCDVGSEVTCDLPLPGGTRKIQGRVTRTQPLPDASTGIGIQFVDLTTGDSSSLHRALEGSGSRPVAVKVMFEGMASPIKCQGVITADGIRLSTSLPFLRLGSDVKAVFDGAGGQTGARGVLTGVRLEPVAGDGVPRLGVEVDLEAEAAASGEQAAPAAGRDYADLDTPDITAVVARPGRSSFAWTRVESFHAWGFVGIATVAFSIVYGAMYRLAPGAADTRRPAAPAVTETLAPHRRTSGPLVVRTGVGPSFGITGPTPESGNHRDAARSTGVSPPGVAAPAANPATTPAARPAQVRQPGSPFRFNSASGRYQLRRGAALDMQGTSLTGVGGIAATDGAAGNLRGINVSVEAGSLYFAVPFERQESDAKFGVQVTPSWPTPLAIVGKTTTGFTVSFGTPAPADAHFDWFLVR